MFKKDAIHIAELMIGLYEKRGGGYSQKEALKFLIKTAKECKCQKEDEFSLWRNINKWDEEFEDEIYIDKDWHDFDMIYSEKYCFENIIMDSLKKYCGLKETEFNKQKIKIQCRNDEIRIKKINDENKK